MAFEQNKKLHEEDIEKVYGGVSLDISKSSGNTYALVIDKEWDIITLAQANEVIIATIKSTLAADGITLSSNDEALIAAFLNENKANIGMGSIIYVTINSLDATDKIKSITM